MFIINSIHPDAGTPVAPPMQRSASQLEYKRPNAPSMTPRQKSCDDLKRHQVRPGRSRVTHRSTTSQRKWLCLEEHVLSTCFSFDAHLVFMLSCNACSSWKWSDTGSSTYGLNQAINLFLKESKWLFYTSWFVTTILDFLYVLLTIDTLSKKN